MTRVARHLSRLLAGCRERAYRDEWDGWVDENTDHALRRVLILIDNSAAADEIILAANAQTDVGQLDLPLVRA
jgi:hypothetical protein